MKTQKTVYMDVYEAEELKKGDEVILCEKVVEGSVSDDGYFYVKKHLGEGIPGNLNKEIKRYHGWRGMTDGVAMYAYGVRKIIKIQILPDDTSDKYGLRKGYKITVGKDLHPDWE